VLRIKFKKELGPMKGEVINNGNIYIFEELHNLNISRTVVNVIKSKKLGRAVLGSKWEIWKVCFWKLEGKR